MKKSTVLSVLVIVLLIPATLYLGTRLTGRMYYLTGTLIIIETMLPFFFRFEGRKPQARELVMLAVMCALATVSRVAVPIPSFKPITAIIMISGIAFGAEAGFLTGAVSAFASNFFYSQGPWTPWQMMAYGVGGFLAGLVFSRKRTRNPILLAIFGFIAVFVLVGPILDLCTVFTTLTEITWEGVVFTFARGLVANVNHSISTAVTLLLLGKTLLEKLDRLKLKYGMMEI